MNNEIPTETIRAMGAVLVAIFDIARDGLHGVVARLRPLVEPPGDMRVTTRSGVIYTGILLIERGEVIAGIVFEVGRISSGPVAPSGAVVTPPPRYEAPGRFESAERFDERSGRLPGWAEDSRELFDEEERWRRR